MNAARNYCQAVARSIRELDRCSLGAPQAGQDMQDWQQARTLLYAILERNGFELSQANSSRLRRPQHQRRERCRVS